MVQADRMQVKYLNTKKEKKIQKMIQIFSYELLLEFNQDMLNLL